MQSFLCSLTNGRRVLSAYYFRFGGQFLDKHFVSNLSYRSSVFLLFAGVSDVVIKAWLDSRFDSNSKAHRQEPTTWGNSVLGFVQIDFQDEGKMRGILVRTKPDVACFDG